MEHSVLEPGQSWKTISPTTEEPSLLRQLSGRGDEDLCQDPQCGGQLAVIRGPVLVPDRKAPAGSVYIREGSARDKRQSFVGCGTCGKPVSENHPRQTKLDHEWATVEAKDVAALKRAQAAPNGARAPVDQVMPLQYIERLLDGMRVANEDAQKRHEEALARIDRRLTALEAKPKK